MQDRAPNDQFLKMDFNRINKYVIKINNEKVKEIIINEIKQIDEEVNNFNMLYELENKENAENKLISMLRYLKTIDDSIFNTPCSGHHRTLVNCIQERMRSTLSKFKDEHFKKVEPVAALIKRDPELHLEKQQDLLNRPDVQPQFKIALNEIKQIAMKNGSNGSTVYISHAQVDSNGYHVERNPAMQWVLPFLVKLHAHLNWAGIHPKLNPTDRQIGNSIFEFMKQISQCDFVLHIGTPQLLSLHEAKTSLVVCEELNYIREKYKLDAKMSTRTSSVLPILIAGQKEEDSFPIEFRNYRVAKDWGNSKTYFQLFCELIPILYSLSPVIFQPVWNKFLDDIPEKVKSSILSSTEITIPIKTTPEVTKASTDIKMSLKKILFPLDELQKIFDTNIDIELNQKINTVIDKARTYNASSPDLIRRNLDELSSACKNVVTTIQMLILTSIDTKSIREIGELINRFILQISGQMDPNVSHHPSTLYGAAEQKRQSQVENDIQQDLSTNILSSTPSGAR